MNKKKPEDYTEMEDLSLTYFSSEKCLKTQSPIYVLPGSFPFIPNKHTSGLHPVASLASSLSSFRLMAWLLLFLLPGWHFPIHDLF